MKKMMLVMAAASLVVGSSVWAQSETVTSVNVVGYYSVTIPANSAALITPVLETLDGATIKELLGNQIPGGLIYIWSRTNANYVTAEYNEFSEQWEGAAANKTLLLGDALWVVPPKDGTPHTITMMGEVPTNSTTQVQNVGKDAVGYAYPIDIEWTSTQLAQDAPYGSLLYIWNMQTSAYLTYEKDAFVEGWTTPPGLKIKQGEAFWIMMPSTFPGWTEIKPYTL